MDHDYSFKKYNKVYIKLLKYIKLYYIILYYKQQL